MSASLEHPEPFQLLADHVALDFVNTLDDRYSAGGPLEKLTSFGRLLAFVEQTGILSQAESRHLAGTVHGEAAQRALGRAVELREALFGLFMAAIEGSSPSAEALGVLNRHLHEPDRACVVGWDGSHDGSPYVWRTNASAVDTETLLRRIAQHAADLLISADLLARVKECGAASCRWMFLDRSRNHSRRWCDMKTCGNRTKARRFHARRQPS